MGPITQYVDEVSLTEIHWIVYPECSGGGADTPKEERRGCPVLPPKHGNLYLDDGYSFDYKKGDSAVITLNCTKSGDSFELSFSQTGNYQHTVTTHHIEIIGGKNADVTLNGNIVPTEQGQYGQIIRDISNVDKVIVKCRNRV